ncbi:MAG: peptidoglycan editing factor PgeF [Nitrospira sp.]|nr:peptidoglycan editing factor PgeF [Nitrospira sp.]MCP9441291.1 peptidoglycan editing factor PgeF [Nitrospira sp.]
MGDTGIITVPAFAPAGSEVRHFFGTRRYSAGLRLEVGTPVFVPQLAGGVHSSWLLSVKQVHGTDPLVVDRALTPDDRFLGGWDALITDQPGIMVAVRTADCVPVLLHDPRRAVVAAVHAGWRGAVAGIVERTVGVMTARFGTSPEHLRVSIGPSAGGCCYEVDEPVLEGVYRACSQPEKVVRSRRGGKKGYLDLKLLVRQQALAVGVKPNAISSVNVCTICHGDLFFSYRRDGKVVGTMVSAIGLVPRPENKRASANRDALPLQYAGAR